MKKLFLLMCFLPAFTLHAQQVYKFGEGTTCVVKGTSTLHDWTATASEVSGMIELDKSFAKKGLPKEGATIEKASFSVVVKSLDGGRGATMNNKINDAFNADEHPNISFNLTKAEVTSVDKANQKFVLNLTGKLSMAGKTKEVNFPMTGTVANDGAYVFDGEKEIDMTTYGMETPSAMFGQIETGKDVNVILHLVAKP